MKFFLINFIVFNPILGFSFISNHVKNEVQRVLNNNDIQLGNDGFIVAKPGDPGNYKTETTGDMRILCKKDNSYCITTHKISEHFSSGINILERERVKDSYSVRRYFYKAKDGKDFFSADGDGIISITDCPVSKSEKNNKFIMNCVHVDSSLCAKLNNKKNFPDWQKNLKSCSMLTKLGYQSFVPPNYTNKQIREAQSNKIQMKKDQDWHNSLAQGQKSTKELFKTVILSENKEYKLKNSFPYVSSTSLSDKTNSSFKSLNDFRKYIRIVDRLGSLCNELNPKFKYDPNLSPNYKSTKGSN